MNRIKTLVKGRLALRGRLPKALLVAACVAALPAIVGCVAYVHGGFPIVIGSRHPYYYDHYYHARPHSSYFCYDCHGYTYFDPYYDYCVNFGFRIDWRHHTPLWRYYSRHHDRIVIKRGFPQYRYKYDYREGPRYKGPVNFEQWRKTDGRTYYSTKQKSAEIKKSTDVKKSTGEKSTKTKTKTTTKTTTKTKSSSGKK
jgi:hypothetical protein